MSSPRGLAPEAAMAELLIGATPVMQRLRALIARVAPSTLPVLIQGPTGVGKELVAAALHRWSGRTGKLVALNVCALGDAMFEDALFGHVQGAFTGALRDAPGYLLEGHEGTVFLDEISGLPLTAQAKLLRALETRQFRAVGGSHDRRSEFRLVAATNDDTARLVASGSFRADLAYRLRGVVIDVPALTERRADIPMLARHFLEASAPRAALELGADAASELMAHSWAGNVRELKHVIERAALDVSRGRLTRSDVRTAPGTGRTTRSPIEPDPDERQRLQKLLLEHRGDTEKVASALGMHRTTVYRRMEQHGIEPPKRTSRARSGTVARPGSEEVERELR